MNRRVYSGALDEIGHLPDGRQGPTRPGINNPALEHVENVGPIPKGRYTVGPHIYNHPRGLADPVLPLIPDAETLANFPKDRKPYTFLIHGESPGGGRDASEGCIILSPDTARLKIKAGETVVVTDETF